MTMQPRSVFTVSAAGLFAFLACTSDLPAPDEYLTTADTSTSTTGVPGELDVDCGNPPPAAVDANYDHTVSVMAGFPPFTFQAQGLEPFTIDAGGTITGVPTAAGSVSATINVTDSQGNIGMTTCQITIREKIDATVPEANLLPCVSANESFDDYLVPGTGDDTPLTCTVLAGSGTGNGTIPDGLSVDPDTCVIEGTITENRYGTWVWMVEADQNGAKAYLPYCATQDMQDAGAYAISLEHDDDVMTQDVLVPARATFSAGSPFSWGSSMDPVPRFEIVDPAECGNPCFFGFAYFINSPQVDMVSLSASGLLKDMANSNIGFFHHLTVTGPAVPASIADRPWVLSLSLDYCLANTGNMNNHPCNGASNVVANGNGNLEFAIVMFPG